MQQFKSPGSAQRFASVRAAACNAFSAQRYLTSRRALRLFRAEAMGGGAPQRQPPLHGAASALPRARTYFP